MLVLGDFNDILGNQEKVGGNIRTESSLEDFNDFVNNLIDLGFIGIPFTWQRRCMDKVMIKE